jgi:hypothetical protein
MFFVAVFFVATFNIQHVTKVIDIHQLSLVFCEVMTRDKYLTNVVFPCSPARFSISSYPLPYFFKFHFKLRLASMLYCHLLVMLLKYHSFNY